MAHNILRAQVFQYQIAQPHMRYGRLVPQLEPMHLLLLVQIVLLKVVINQMVGTLIQQGQAPIIIMAQLILQTQIKLSTHNGPVTPTLSNLMRMVVQALWRHKPVLCMELARP